MKTTEKKLRIHQAAIEHAECTIKNIASGLERTRQECIDAPGFASTRSDTSKTQLGWSVAGLTKRLADARRDLDLLRSCPLAPSSSRVEVGSLVSVVEDNDTDGAATHSYLIVPGGCGAALSVDDDSEVLVLSPVSPLARVLMGSRVGDVVTLRIGHDERRMEVVKVA